ncbi:hypothetical protein IMCC12053_927 [Celeribacter marinus]|uniref:Uncharacterized protein n=1 Tax=Celeribacter marinus TaxID=1397108 RepID=A0A0P0A8R6_9RHOB|nr:hypothetical protein IMCC12053_927 [Celeribacter marinus]
MLSAVEKTCFSTKLDMDVLIRDNSTTVIIKVAKWYSAFQILQME